MKKIPINILKTIEILSLLSDEELKLLYSHMNTEEYCKGKALFNEGDTGEIMYIILSGSVSISVNTPDGKVLEIAEISTGNFFGEMSIFDSAVRSATCSPKCDTTVLSLKADDFYEFIKNNPIAGSNIMQQMLKITALRLNKTGAFLSDMVTWGGKARTRAITDDFTGLYNRRFLDEAMEDRLAKAKTEGTSLSVIMIDLDNFGTLNNEYGQNIGDKIILAVVPIFKKMFRKEDILARYGGDEFTFLLPGIEGQEALTLCSKLVCEIRKINLLDKLGGPVKDVTASIGIACFPDHAESASKLREIADKALYVAKDKGRDRVVLWGTDKGGSLVKTKIKSISIRNRIIDNILNAISERDGFLIMGHKNPDDDCISSMIAMGLLINKFSRTVYLLIPEKINENYQYLLNICRYNAIELIHNNKELPSGISTVFFMDTPKPDMRET
ncbi:MAG: diguanylate cyclase, partial [Spirochaetota bacterium]|nr:diguanylate cyclase [Spirochaetota bacterium]